YDGPLADNRNELLNTYAFAQDKFQVSRKLTLNLGVRFDRYHSCFPSQANPGTGPFASTAFFATQKYATNYDRHDMAIFSNLVPRLAFVYYLRGNGKTALKARYGRYAENTGTFASNVNPQAIHNTQYNLCNATRTTGCATLPITVAKIA